jgi:hypothetical protein
VWSPESNFLTGKLQKLLLETAGVFLCPDLEQATTRQYKFKMFGTFDKDGFRSVSGKSGFCPRFKPDFRKFSTKYCFPTASFTFIGNYTINF